MTEAIETHQQQATDLVVRAKELRITNHAEYEEAAGIGRDLRDFRARIEEYWNGTDESPGPVKRAYAAWKSLTAKRAEMIDPIDSALAVLTRSITAYDREQERQRQETQRRLEEEARSAREKQIADELAAAKAEGAKKTELRAMEQAAKAVPVVAPTVAAAAKPDGLSIPKRWKCRMNDRFLFIAEVGRLLNSKSIPEQQFGRTLASFLDFHEAAANRQATNWQNTVSIPGLEFYDDSKPRFGGGRK